MTKLIVNGLPVLVQYLPLEAEESKWGSILQIFIEQPRTADCLHTSIIVSLKQRFSDGGIMEDIKLKPQKGTPPDRLFSEIRILNQSILWFCDHLRTYGFAVIEEPPKN